MDLPNLSLGGDDPMIIFGHRGFAGCFPENTLLSFQEALKSGATGLECDVQLSSDGEIMVFHDETLQRITGEEGYLKDYTASQLRKLDVGSHKMQEYKGLQIPFLHEVLELLKGTETLLNIELKNGLIPYPGLEEKILKEVQKADYTDKVILSSFNHNSLVTLHALNPEVELAILYMARLYKPWRYALELGAKALHPYWAGITSSMVEQAHKHGLKVRVFTVNRARNMRRMLKAGVDGIITDYPPRLQELMKPTAISSKE